MSIISRTKIVEHCVRMKSLVIVSKHDDQYVDI